MSSLIGTSPVGDFDHWHSSFEDNESFRREHGELGYQVFRSESNPEEVTVIFHWDDDEDAGAFFRSGEMRERMEEAGISGAPELTPIELVDERVARTTAA